MKKKHLVKSSKIHGTGVFAKCDIKKGEKIIEYVGKKITKEKSEKIAEKTLELSKSNPHLGGVYIFDLNKKYDLDGNFSYNSARYINHSCNPNAESEQDHKDRIWIKALKDIKKGDEITYNYSYDFLNVESHICKCGSDNCVGYILAKKHWKKLSKK
jgi:uncharacterized protein